MTWFEELTGIPETSPAEVREQVTVDGEQLTSLANGRAFIYGRLETPSLAKLRERVVSCGRPAGRTTVCEVVADVRDLHADESNAGSLFQVASQFNLLEMADPHLTPEHGVGIYEHDLTQGPACAISAGAGTIYRNYFAGVNGRIGQTADNQIDCLADLGTALGNTEGRLWEMRNGYALATHDGLDEISRRLRASSEAELDQLRQLLRIGIQSDTQVTIRDSKHRVTQVFCSALPVAYCQHDLQLWEAFGRLVLVASYEATICAAILNSQATQNDQVFLTLVGGGAFGNATEWITDAIRRAVKLYEHSGLEIAIVSYDQSDHRVRQLVGNYSG